MYRSGLFTSSRGGTHVGGPVPSAWRTLRVHARCFQGKSTSCSFCTTYTFDTLKWCLSAPTPGTTAPNCDPQRRAGGCMRAHARSSPRTAAPQRSRSGRAASRPARSRCPSPTRQSPAVAHRGSRPHLRPAARTRGAARPRTSARRTARAQRRARRAGARTRSAGSPAASSASRAARGCTPGASAPGA
jgi:hypothetical protein